MVLLVPEGATIHRLARDLAPLTGLPVAASSPNGRFAEGACAVSGQVLVRVEARGDRLLLRFAFGDVVHVQGEVRRVDGSAPVPASDVVLRLDGGTGLVWDVVAPSTCELLSVAEAASLTA